MNKYTYAIIGLSREYDVIAETQRDAHKKCWRSLSVAEQNACECLDLIDIERNVSVIPEAQFNRIDHDLGVLRLPGGLMYRVEGDTSDDLKRETLELIRLAKLNVVDVIWNFELPEGIS